MRFHQTVRRQLLDCQAAEWEIFREQLESQSAFLSTQDTGDSASPLIHPKLLHLVSCDSARGAEFDRRMAVVIRCPLW